MGLVSVTKMGFGAPDSRPLTSETSHQTRPSSRVILSMEEPVVESSHWRLRARSIRLLDAPLILEIDEAHYTPCLSENSFVSIRSRQAILSISQAEYVQLTLSEPTVKIGPLHLPLPELTIWPRDPQLGIVEVGLRGDRLWFEIGPTLHYAQTRWTPTVLHGAHRYGVGLHARRQALQLSTRAILNQSGERFDGLQLESRGGDNLLALYGGLGAYVEPLELVLGQSMLRDRLSLRPTRLWGKLNLYQSRSLWSGLAYIIDEGYPSSLRRKQTLLQRVSWSTYTQGTYVLSSSKSLGFKWSASHHLQSLMHGKRYDRDNILRSILIENKISLMGGPRYYSKVGESQLLLGATHRTSDSYMGKRLWIGGEHEMIVRRDFDNQKRHLHDQAALSDSDRVKHEIHLNPRYLFSLIDSEIFPNDLYKPQVEEGGVLVSQFMMWGDYTLELDCYGGYIGTGSTQRRLSDETRRYQSLGAIRARIENSYVLLNYQGKTIRGEENDHPVHDDFLVSIPVGRSLKKPRQYSRWRDWSGRISLAHSRLQSVTDSYLPRPTLTGFFDQLFIPLSRQLEVSSGSLSEGSLGRSYPTPMPKSRQMAISKVELMISAGPLALESQVSIIDIQLDPSLNAIRRPLSVWSRLTWHDSCGCWYISLTGGVVNGSLIDPSMTEESIRVNFGLGESTPFNLIGRALSQ